MEQDALTLSWEAVVTATGCSAWPQQGYGVTIRTCAGSNYLNQNYNVTYADTSSFKFTAKAGLGSATNCSWAYNSVVANGQPYFWDIATNYVVPSRGMVGHTAGMYNNLMHGTNNPQGMAAYIQLPDPANTASFATWSTGLSNVNLVPYVVNSGSITLDSHFSCVGADANDTWPCLGSTSNEIGAAAPSPSPPNTENDGCAHVYPYPVTTAPTCGTTNPFSGPYVQEMLFEPTSDLTSYTTQCSAAYRVSTVIGSKTYYSCAPPLGACTSLTNCQTFWRAGNSGTTVINPIFNIQNATIDLAPDSLAWNWTTDWWGWLGTTDQATVAGVSNGAVSFVSGTTYQITSTLNPPVNQLVTVSGSTGNTSLNANWVVTVTNAAYYRVSSAVSLACASSCGKTNIQPIVGGLSWVKSHAYNTGDIITPASNNYTYQAAGNCTSGATAPSWTTGNPSDNTCTWNYIGIQNLRGDLMVAYIPQS